jgi:uncharacterized damage-inducible protein DinB
MDDQCSSTPDEVSESMVAHTNPFCNSDRWSSGFGRFIAAGCCDMMYTYRLSNEFPTNTTAMAATNLIADCQLEFRRYRQLADRALAETSDGAFFHKPGEAVNPIALIVKHLAGNLKSRWSDFLTTDGDKPSRNRDDEFALKPDDTQAALLDRWSAGWQILEQTLQSLTPEDLAKTVTIRGEPHTVQQALVRSMNHTSYHVGQILYLVRLAKPNAAWQTIAPGQSKSHRPSYRST